jgi:hypothetical protein
MQGSQTPWVMVLSSRSERQLFTPSRELHQAQTRYAVVLAERSTLISVPFDGSVGWGREFGSPK